MKVGFAGHYGNAQTIPVTTHPDVVCAWLMTMHYMHPTRRQYLLTVLTLDDPAHCEFPTATHRMIVQGLGRHYPLWTYRTLGWVFNQHHTYDAEQLHDVQFAATDEEMVHVAADLALGCSQGRTNPDLHPDPSELRTIWRDSCDMTLAHARGLHPSERNTP